MLCNIIEYLCVLFCYIVTPLLIFWWSKEVDVLVAVSLQFQRGRERETKTKKRIQHTTKKAIIIRRPKLYLHIIYVLLQWPLKLSILLRIYDVKLQTTQTIYSFMFRFHTLITVTSSALSVTELPNSLPVCLWSFESLGFPFGLTTDGCSLKINCFGTKAKDKNEETKEDKWKLTDVFDS